MAAVEMHAAAAAVAEAVVQAAAHNYTQGGTEPGVTLGPKSELVSN